jgi:uncharacterized protein involved in type VI secretion and phage assembly
VGAAVSAPYWGKYRGVVTDNNDPYRRGRIRARVDGVMEAQETGWAAPCFPITGQSMGWFAVPPVGAHVWIEFELGSPESPLWSGCVWENASDMPGALQSDPVKKIVLRGVAGHEIVIDDTPGTGGIRIETAGGQKLVLDSNGILLEVSSGTSKQRIKIGPSGISVNDGALEVT